MSKLEHGIEAAVIGGAAIGAIQEVKQGKTDISVKVFGYSLLTLAASGMMLVAFGASGVYVAEQIFAVICMIAGLTAFLSIYWVIGHQLMRAAGAVMTPLHPDNFPKFENRPVGELASEITQGVFSDKDEFVHVEGASTRRYLINPYTGVRETTDIDGDPGGRPAIYIQCLTDNCWYKWSDDDSAYMFNSKTDPTL